MDSRPAGRQADGSSDRRWIVVRPDGGFSSLGRAADPTEEQVLRSEKTLVEHGTGGWLAVAEHSFYRPEFRSCAEVRTLGHPSGTFADALEAVRKAVQERE